jgi:hypothetical protein
LTFDLAFALVPRRIEKVSMVSEREMRRQHRDRGQGNFAGGEALENERKPPGRARSLDPAVGRVFGQVQDLGAVREQRRVTFVQVDPSRIEFGECGNEPHRGFAFVGGQPPYVKKQVSVGQTSQVDGGGHDDDVTRSFFKGTSVTTRRDWKRHV